MNTTELRAWALSGPVRVERAPVEQVSGDGGRRFWRNVGIVCLAIVVLPLLPVAWFLKWAL